MSAKKSKFYTKWAKKQQTNCLLTFKKKEKKRRHKTYGLKNFMALFYVGSTFLGYLYHESLHLELVLYHISFRRMPHWVVNLQSPSEFQHMRREKKSKLTAWIYSILIPKHIRNRAKFSQRKEMKKIIWQLKQRIPDNFHLNFFSLGKFSFILYMLQYMFTA